MLVPGGRGSWARGSSEVEGTFWPHAARQGPIHRHYRVRHLLEMRDCLEGGVPYFRLFDPASFLHPMQFLSDNCPALVNPLTCALTHAVSDNCPALVNPLICALTHAVCWHSFSPGKACASLLNHELRAGETTRLLLVVRCCVGSGLSFMFGSRVPTVHTYEPSSSEVWPLTLDIVTGTAVGHAPTCRRGVSCNCSHVVFSTAQRCAACRIGAILRRRRTQWLIMCCFPLLYCAVFSIHSELYTLAARPHARTI